MSKKARRTKGRKAAVSPLLTTHDAALYLSVSRRWLEEQADIPRIDISGQGYGRPMWRYERSTLDRFIALRKKEAARAGP
jgi:hypothetical protein